MFLGLTRFYIIFFLNLDSFRHTQEKCSKPANLGFCTSTLWFYGPKTILVWRPVARKLWWWQCVRIKICGFATLPIRCENAYLKKTNFIFKMVSAKHIWHSSDATELGLRTLIHAVSAHINNLWRMMVVLALWSGYSQPEQTFATPFTSISTNALKLFPAWEFWVVPTRWTWLSNFHLIERLRPFK